MSSYNATEGNVEKIQCWLTDEREIDSQTIELIFEFNAALSDKQLERVLRYLTMRSYHEQRIHRGIHTTVTVTARNRDHYDLETARQKLYEYFVGTIVFRQYQWVEKPERHLHLVDHLPVQPSTLQGKTPESLVPKIKRRFFARLRPFKGSANT